MMHLRLALLLLLVAGALGCAQKQSTPAAEDPGMSFFITSAGPGNGADLGGLDGADRHCQALAEAVGAGNRTWRAYLSASDTAGAVNARDRIGQGPWHNVQGVVVAQNMDELHGDAQHARHPDGFAARRHRVFGGGRHHLWKLDEPWGGQRSGRSSRSPGRRRKSDILELRPWL